MSAWRPILLCALLAMLVFGWFRWRPAASTGPKEVPAPIIDKKPPVVINRTFDPAAPPSDMPPLAEGEAAECDSNFMSRASVAGSSRQSDSTHAVVTLTHVRILLQLKIVIWAPRDASPHVLQHEEGHRQISETYYQGAEGLVERIASKYLGKEMPISGRDLKGEFDKVLQQAGTEITDAYIRELNVQAAQLRFDAITDHSRNDVDARDAVVQALEDARPPSN